MNTFMRYSSCWPSLLIADAVLVHIALNVVKIARE